MKIKLPIFLIAALLIHGFAYSQVSVDNTLTVKQLIEDYLIGEGVEVDNITINGQGENTVNNQAGLYTGTSNFIDFETGIIMATANAQIASGGPSGNLTNPIQNDPDLMIISGQVIKDAVIIEFDFKAISDSIKFNYVFASNEYPSFTCSSFNDAFGFFLSGPGITGPYSNNSINIALIPGTDVPVAINTVNSGVATGGSASNCSNANPDWIEHSQYFVDNSNTPSGDVQFPGMTQTFAAMAGGLQCGEWYHIKLAIGDAVDANLDSGVFLEAGSFTAFGSVALHVEPQIGGAAVVNPLYDSVLVAGCSEIYVELVRPTGVITDSIYVEFGGTAIQEDLDNPIPGADYILGENDTLFFFPEGVDTIGFNIETIWDGIPGEEEFITITIHFQDGCGEWKSVSATIHMVDPYELDSEVDEITLICPADEVLISAKGLNGIEPYTYDWGDYGTGENLNEVVVDVFPGDSTYYKVGISDMCGFETRMDSVLIINNIPAPLEVSINDFVQPRCPNEPIELHASIKNGNPDEDGAYNIIWADANNKSYSIEENVHVFDINKVVLFGQEPNNFTENLAVFITVTDTCGTVAADTVMVNFPFLQPLKVSFDLPQEHCPTEPLILKSKVENGESDFSYTWAVSHGDLGHGADPTSDYVHVVPKPGMNNYTLAVSDYCGRMGFDYLYADENDDFISSGFDFYEDSLKVISLDNIMNVITPNGDNRNDYLVIEGAHEFDDAMVEVFDRWGRVVYKTNNYRAGNPDGPKPDDVFDGKDLEDGTYFYVVKVAGGQCVESGYVEILRAKRN